MELKSSGVISETRPILLFRYDGAFDETHCLAEQHYLIQLSAISVVPRQSDTSMGAP